MPIVGCPSQAEADRAVNEPKVIRENLRWRSESGRWKLEATVFASRSQTFLKLTAVVARQRSYSLLCNNVTLRRLCAKRRRHRNPDGQYILGTHKHRHTDDFSDRDAYKPQAVRIGDPNEELMDFLEECNVTVEGTYQSLMP